MSVQVVKITQSQADSLERDVNWDYDIVRHKFNFPCMNLSDAQIVYGTGFQVVDWIDYTFNGVDVGSPRPRKPKR